MGHSTAIQHFTRIIKRDIVGELNASTTPPAFALVWYLPCHATAASAVAAHVCPPHDAMAEHYVITLTRQQ